MTDIIDISVPLHPRIPVWPGNAGVRLVPLKRMANGDNHNLSALECGVYAFLAVSFAEWWLANYPQIKDL